MELLVERDSEISVLKQFCTRVLGVELLGFSLLIILPFSLGLGFIQTSFAQTSTSSAESLIVLANQYLDQNKPFDALKTVSLIDLNQRNPAIPQALQKILIGIHRQVNENSEMARTAWNLDSPAIAEFLDFHQSKNEDLQNRLADLFSWRVLDALNNDEILSVENAFQKLLDCRPDPNAKNGALRYEIAVNADSGEEFFFAAGRVRELMDAGDLSIWQKFNLFHKGYYGKYLPIGFYLLLTLSILGGVLWKLRPELLLLPFEIMGNLLPQKRAIRGYERVISGNEDEAQDEYTLLLRQFGLHDKASEREIKSAFRYMMKELHPDRQQAESPEQTQALIELKKAHDRIMEIRKSWFAGRKH